MKNYIVIITLFTLLPHWLFSQVFRHSLFVAPNYSGHYFPNAASPELNGFFDKADNNTLGYSMGYRIDKNIRERISFGFGIEYIFSKDAEYLAPSEKNLPLLLGITETPVDGNILMSNELRCGYVSLPVYFTLKLSKKESEYFYLRIGLGISIFAHGKIYSRNEIQWDEGTNTLISELQKDIRFGEFGTKSGIPLSCYGHIGIGNNFNIGNRFFYAELTYSNDLSTWYQGTNIGPYFLSDVKRRILALNIGVQLTKISSE